MIQHHSFTWKISYHLLIYWSVLISGIAGRAHLCEASTHVSGTITTDTIWSIGGSPYIVDTTVIVRAGATLTITPGVVVKMNTSKSLVVEGTLFALGLESDRITFTSIQDDSVAGDSGNDGPTIGEPGQWGSVRASKQGALAVLKYVDVRFGAYGSANHTAAAVTAVSDSTVDLDYCRVYDNQRSGLRVSGATATIAHSEFMRNAIGISATGSTEGFLFQIHSDSRLNDNYQYGLFVNLSGSYIGPPSSIVNSEVARNGTAGVRLQINSGIAAGSVPYGHYNNIVNNAGGADRGQLSTLYVLGQSSWTDNYWGPDLFEVECPWAPPTTQQSHLQVFPSASYCFDPGEGPTTYQVYLLPGGCPNNGSQRCAADWVTNVPFATAPFDNSGL